MFFLNPWRVFGALTITAERLSYFTGLHGLTGRKKGSLFDVKISGFLVLVFPLNKPLYKGHMMRCSLGVKTI